MQFMIVYYNKVIDSVQVFNTQTQNMSVELCAALLISTFDPYFNNKYNN
jgi:hypothetical protein